MKASSTILALVFGWFAWKLWEVGSHAHWTSDGPGMLFIMLAFGFCAVVAAASAYAAIVPELLRRFFEER